MALSETFNLDFKFGGNIEVLAKLESLMQRVDARFDSFEDSVKDTAEATEKMADKVDDLSDSFRDGLGAMNQFGEKLKDIAKYYLSFQAIRAGAERVWSFGMESMDVFATQERAENQLKGVMKNRGTLGQFQTIKDYAAEIQGRSIYGDEAMIRGAGELATYVKGTESLKSMMALLTDYAAGMTGGGEVSPEQMESLATGLGMAYDGNYMAMRRKGFDTSKLEALDAIVETGGVWGAKEKKKYGDVLDAALLQQIRAAGGVTEQMRVDALKESLKDWQGLSDAVNDLDSSALIKFNNALSDLRENVGERIYPVFNGLVATIDEKMPQIEAFFDRIGDMFTSMSDSIGNHMESLFEIGTHLVDILPSAVEFGLNLLQVVDEAVFKFAGFREAVVALTGAMAVNVVFGYKKQIISTAFEIRKTTVELGKACLEMRRAQFSLKEIGSTMASLGRLNLNNAFKGATAQMLLFAGALWGLQKIFEAGTAAIELYRQSKMDEQMREADAKHGKAVEDYESASRQRANAKKALEKFRSEHGYRDTPGSEGYYDAYGNQIVGLEKEEEIYRNYYNAADAAYRQAKISLGVADEARELRRSQIYGSSEKNPYLEKIEKMNRDLQTTGKTEIHQAFNNTYIDQKVNVAAEVEKIGMLLNFSVRAAIAQAMKQNRNQMVVGEI